MMRLIKISITILFALLILAGCGSSGSSSEDSPPPSQLKESSYELKLSTPGLEPGVLVSKEGQATIRAYVVKIDIYDNGNRLETPVADGTVVDFYTISTDTPPIDFDWKESVIFTSGRITPVKTTVNGYADALYLPGNYGGEVKIYARCYDSKFDEWGDDDTYISDTISFAVATGTPAAIAIGNITSETISVAGSGIANTSSITFKVNDSSGNPVLDYSPILFKIATPLGGGEKLSATQAETQNGNVYVTLISGTVSGTVGVNATYYDPDTGLSISTEAKITIVSGLPAAEQLGMAVEFYNIAGGRTFGLQNSITIYLGDRYGNIVPDGTKVSLMSEGGTIGTSDGFDPTTEFGVAQAILQTSPPTTPNLGGVQGSTLGNPGLCRVVVYTPGDEGFNDINGNNVYDEGIDVLTQDMSEPYIDSNDNGVYDIGEKYIDVNGDGKFTEADGIYQANTMIWTSLNVLFSAEIAPINLTFVPDSDSDSDFTLSDEGGSVKFTFNIGDEYENALVGGTAVDVTFEAPEGTILSGFKDFVVTDSLEKGKEYSFTLRVPAAKKDETNKDEDNKNEDKDYIPHIGPLSVTVTVTPPEGSAAGTNSGGGPVSETLYGDWESSD